MKPLCSIRQLIRLSLAVGLLAACLAPGPIQAQGPPENQGLWQTFTTANSGLRNNHVTTLMETVNDTAEVVCQRVWILVDETERLLELARMDPEVLHRLRCTIQNCPALRGCLGRSQSPE